MINALITALRRKQTLPFLEDEQKISILVPCYNEELLIEYSINNMLNLNYINYEVISINDGSSDYTMEKLNKILKLKKFYYKNRYIYKSSVYEKFYVINNCNMGKGESLNTGINIASSPLIVTLDADSALHRDALKHMNRAFFDENIVAAGGAIHIIQGYEKKTNLNVRRNNNAADIGLYERFLYI
jgi:cellulose synthase/poly-beta-1,6-N-acetylglucosamine synthase-like glycosyltransferase